MQTRQELLKQLVSCLFVGKWISRTNDFEVGFFGVVRVVEDIGDEGSDMKEINILRWLGVQMSYMSDALSTFGITMVSKFGARSFSRILTTFLVIGINL